MKFPLAFVTLLVDVTAQSSIIDDLNQRISPQVTKLANDVEEFPDSGLGGAIVSSAAFILLISLTAHLGHRLRREGPCDFL
jgi:hypothetical protein